jgi:hypothetical protein
MLIIVLGVSQAQTVELGLRYNPEFTWLLNKNDNNAGSSLNLTSNFAYYSLGAGGIINFNNYLGIAVDILFSREGQRFEGSFAGSFDVATYSLVIRRQLDLNIMENVINYVAKAELNYIKIPLMISLTSDNTKQFFFTLQAGPQFNFLVDVAQEVNHHDLDYPNSNINPIDLYKSFTINGVLAVGSAYNLSSHLILSAKVRVDYGFNDVENKDIMVSYNGAAPFPFYSPDRQATHSLTVGLLLGLDFKL